MSNGTTTVEFGSPSAGGDQKARKHKVENDVYEKELARLQIELAKLQEWVKHEGLRVVVLFEGRDAAGKGGVIERITESLDPRICRVVALGRPTEKEKTSWYFQRYVTHLPSAGEIVLFDRSWKLSPMDVESRMRWVDYSKAKDEMFAHTDTPHAPWSVVKADVKKCARLNCISHLLSLIDYEDLSPTPDALPPRPPPGEYVRPPIDTQSFIPEIW